MRKVLIAVLLFCVFAVVGCDSTNKALNEDSSDNTIIAGTYEKDVFNINTSYGILRFPQRWENITTIEVEDNTVHFIHTTTNTRLFDVSFNSGEGYTVGSYSLNEKTVNVIVNTFEFDKTLEEYELFCNIQDDINVIINYLVSDYKFVFNGE